MRWGFVYIQLNLDVTKLKNVGNISLYTGFRYMQFHVKIGKYHAKQNQNEADIASEELTSHIYSGEKNFRDFGLCLLHI